MTLFLLRWWFPLALLAGLIITLYLHAKTCRQIERCIRRGARFDASHKAEQRCLEILQNEYSWRLEQKRRQHRALAFSALQIALEIERTRADRNASNVATSNQNENNVQRWIAEKSKNARWN